MQSNILSGGVLLTPQRASHRYTPGAPYRRQLAPVDHNAERIKAAAAKRRDRAERMRIEVLRGGWGKAAQAAQLDIEVPDWQTARAGIKGFRTMLVEDGPMKGWRMQFRAGELTGVVRPS